MDRRGNNVSDEELLTRLAASFPVEQIEPDASSLRHLSVAVAQLRSPAVAEVPARTTRRRAGRISLPRRLSPVVTIGSLVGALAMGTGISYAVGVPIPAAVRSVARTVGLAAPTPATFSPAVAAASQAESTLHHALTNANSSPAAISRDTSALAHRLAQVGGDHAPGAQRVSADGHHLLTEACQGSSPAGHGAVGGGSGRTTPTGGAPSSAINPCALIGGQGTSGGSITGRGRVPTSTGTTTTTSGGHGDRVRSGSGASNGGKGGPTNPVGGSTRGGSVGAAPSGTQHGTSGNGSSGNSGSSVGSTDQHHAAGGQTLPGRPATTSTLPTSTGSGFDGKVTSPDTGPTGRSR
jgi:hypothetical protein